MRGRDGCRVPLPWVADAPSYGFGPGPASWLPQPAFWARVRAGPAARRGRLHLRAVPGGAAAAARAKARRPSRWRWLDLGPDVVAFRTGDTLVVANLGDAPVALPAGYTALLASTGVATAIVAADTTVWASEDR